jgi:hypothetical protein
MQLHLADATHQAVVCGIGLQLYPETNTLTFIKVIVFDNTFFLIHTDNKYFCYLK